MIQPGEFGVVVGFVSCVEQAQFIAFNKSLAPKVHEQMMKSKTEPLPHDDVLPKICITATRQTVYGDAVPVIFSAAKSVLEGESIEDKTMAMFTLLFGKSSILQPPISLDEPFLLCVDLTLKAACHIRQVATKEFDDERTPTLNICLSVPVVRITVGLCADDGLEREPLLAEWNVMDVQESIELERAGPATPPRDAARLISREVDQSARAEEGRTEFASS